MTLPELDPEQRRAALAKATEARRARAELKQMLKAGEIGFAELLDRAEHVPPLRKMRVSEVIEAMPGYGKVRADQLMERTKIARSRRIQGLGSKQRAQLLAEFDR